MLAVRIGQLTAEVFHLLDLQPCWLLRTLIALAADEIVPSKHAALGPVDPQLGRSPAASLLKVIEQKPVADIDDQILIIADVGRKAIAQVKQSVRDVLELMTLFPQPVRAQAGGVEYLPNVGRGMPLGAHPTRCHDRNGPQGE